MVFIFLRNFSVARRCLSHLTKLLWVVYLSTLCASTTYAQDDAALIRQLEEDRLTLEISAVLRKIDSLLLGDTIEKETLRTIEAIKVDALVEAHLYNDALTLSNDLLSVTEGLDVITLHKLRLQRALLYEILEDFERSNSELEHLTEYYKKNLKDDLYGKYLYRRSSYYRVQQTEEYDSLAKIYARKAVAYGEEVNDPEVSGTGAMLLAFLQKDIQSEKNYLDEALKYFKQTSDLRDDANIYLRLGRRALEKENYDSALNYINLVQEIGEEMDALFLKKLSRKEKSRIYERLEMPDSALYYFKEYKQYDEEMAFLNQQDKVSQINYKYEIDKRRTANVETEKRLEQEQFNVRILFLLLSVLAIGLVGTIYLWQRIRYKNKENIEQKDVIAQKNYALEDTVDKKDFYLRELNHRVKNNLSLILSLISFQKQEQADSQMTRKFDDLEQRVRAIALAHQEFLYDEEHNTGKKVALDEYIKHIDQGLCSITHRKMNCEVIAQKLLVPIEIAMPLGIIVNELITNSIKHTDPEDHLKIKINIAEDNGLINFSYKDSGAGYEKEKISPGLGLFIIESMVSQLEGKLVYKNRMYDISIPLDYE